jgi:hypothetical protein
MNCLVLMGAAEDARELLAALSLDLAGTVGKEDMWDLDAELVTHR